jgi:hypothetical protein
MEEREIALSYLVHFFSFTQHATCSSEEEVAWLDSTCRFSDQFTGAAATAVANRSNKQEEIATSFSIFRILPFFLLSFSLSFQRDNNNHMVSFNHSFSFLFLRCQKQQTN